MYDYEKSWIEKEWSETSYGLGLPFSGDEWNRVKGLCPRCGSKLCAFEYDESFSYDEDGNIIDEDSWGDDFQCPECGLNYNLDHWGRWSEEGPWSQ